MLDGLGIRTPEPKLTEEEEGVLDDFFALLSIAPSEYYAIPKERREQIAALMQTWHLMQLYLTRTAIKKQ